MSPETRSVKTDPNLIPPIHWTELNLNVDFDQFTRELQDQLPKKDFVLALGEALEVINPRRIPLSRLPDEDSKPSPS